MAACWETGLTAHHVEPGWLASLVLLRAVLKLFGCTHVCGLGSCMPPGQIHRAQTTAHHGHSVGTAAVCLVHHNTQNIKTLACRRKLEDLTIGPVLSWTTDAMLAHAARLLKIPGAQQYFVRVSCALVGHMS